MRMSRGEDGTSDNEPQCRIAIFPEAKTNVNSLVNLSRSRWMMVPSSSTSSVRSVTLMDLHAAM